MFNNQYSNNESYFVIKIRLLIIDYSPSIILPTMQLHSLKPKLDSLQSKFGSKRHDAIYGAGCIKKPKVCFIFMNPTARNVSASKLWKGLKAPWIGTKQVWKLFKKLNLFGENLLNEIRSKKREDWTVEFADKVYDEVKRNKFYITNLAKCTQVDARPLKNDVFKSYIPLMHKEIEMLKPKIIVSFGNQVSSLLLNENISVSKVRQKKFDLKINRNEYPSYSVYYPVGQGMRNIDKAIEDIGFILNSRPNAGS